MSQSGFGRGSPVNRNGAAMYRVGKTLFKQYANLQQPLHPDQQRPLLPNIPMASSNGSIVDDTEIIEDDLLHPKKFLVVVTAGGKSNAAPLFEIAQILQSRGHKVEFGTLEGQEKWVAELPFISRTHILGPGVPVNVEEENYLEMTKWNNSSGWTHDFKPMFRTMRFLQQSWPNVYHSLKAIMLDESRRPDFILADYWVDAVKDMMTEFNIPIAMHWPQMPTNMLHADHIPGVPGLQIEVLTSEYATLRQRLKNDLLRLSLLPGGLMHRYWLRKMRIQGAGLYRMIPRLAKPDHLLLVNSFFGIEAPKDLPPLVAAVGPILAEAYLGMDTVLREFMASHEQVLYVALGTHVLLPHDTLASIMAGVCAALDSGIVSGVVWAIRGMARKQLDLSAPSPTRLNEQKDKATIGELLTGADPDMYFMESAPQRAVLAHPNTKAYLSHGGPASSNEAAYHGVPMITIAVYFDQLQNAMRLRDAGVSIPLQKDRFTSQQLGQAIKKIVEDETGEFKRNTQRLKAIARVASRRKYYAADLVEEFMADWEGRKGSGRTMHLQTADARMPRWKLGNLDLFAVKMFFIANCIGIVFILNFMVRTALSNMQ